jgi:hypothetical protein
MRLTPLAKAFIAVVVLAVIGFATWHYKGAAIKEWAGGERATGEDSKADFDKLNNSPGDPGRNVGSTGVSRHWTLEPAARRRHKHLGRTRARHRLQ